MKNKILALIVVCFAVSYSSYTQYIPNAGFEDWETRLLFEEPENWNTGNQETFFLGEATALRTTDCYSGDLALRLENLVIDEDTIFGYAMSNASITGVGDTLHFIGGIPVSDAPDFLYGYFKYEITEDDTAMVLISFKNAGEIISQTFFPITGTQSAYTQMEFEIPSMPETPDTALIAFTCSNPFHPMAGGWLQVDTIWWEGIDDTIPNADFEVWDETSHQDPENWFTANLFACLFGGDVAATHTTDAHSGSYALRLEAIETIIPSDEGMTEAVVGFAIPFEDSYDFTESVPTFSVDFNPKALSGYYKFEPILNDTAMIVISLLDNEGYTIHQTGTYLLAAGTYQEFDIPLDYTEPVTVSEVSIIVSTTLYFMETGENSGEEGSVLYLDDLALFNPCDTFPALEIVVTDEPDCDDNTAILDAGEGWDEYLWSNSETTQIITVAVTETTTYNVTVANSESGCEFTDDVAVSPATGCETIIKPGNSRSPLVELYPNPASELLTMEFQYYKPGLYAVEIIDITGKVIVSKITNINETRQKVMLDLTGYAEGLYLVRISGNNHNYSTRLMIQ